MDETPKKDKGRAVPSRRLSRLMGFGGMAANIAGGAALSGAKQLASGNRPTAADLFLTPKNIKKLTQQLSHMRGAAMKLGQMISIDSGDFLPKELADILAQLRASAHHMPAHQLGRVLKSEWGNDWLSRFEQFQTRPLAAASIGQVHRASLPTGEALAVKVQYPGVRESIDSDINNVGSLLRLSGLVPASMDVTPLIEEGRRQLHQEADYHREAEYLQRFAKLLEADEAFQVPEYYADLSTDKILTMSFLKGRPIEEMVEAPQAVRNRMVLKLMELTLRELFEFKLMQTDPNFANYQYNADTGQIILLDFGAARDIEDDLSRAYHKLLEATLSLDAAAILEQAIEMGLAPKHMSEEARATVLKMIEMGVAPLAADAPFDFGNIELPAALKEEGFELARDKDLWHVPPAQSVFIQRKLGGMYMLATRLEAKVNVAALMKDYVERFAP